MRLFYPIALVLVLAAPSTNAQDAISNGNFDTPDIPKHSVQSAASPTAWSLVKFLVDGDNGPPWPATATFEQFVGPSGAALEQTFVVPPMTQVTAVHWQTTAADDVASVQFEVRVESDGGATAHESSFKAFGGAQADAWDAQVLHLPKPLSAGSYTLTFQRSPGDSGEYFIDKVSAPLGVLPSNIDPANTSAWSANAGWVSFSPAPEHGVLTTEGYLARHAYAANTGWIFFGDGSPADGIAYSNTTGGDSGVNVSYAGDLSGLGWGANTGWINFGWTTTSDPKRPRIDLATGEFEGYAWGANTGWLNLGAGQLFTDSFHCIDTDGDGIGDGWEQQHFGDLSTADASSDADGDGILDSGEYLSLSDPADPARYLAIVEHDPDPLEKVQLVFTSAPGRLYRIELSENLETWTDSGLGAFLPDSGETTTRSVALPDRQRQFYRVLATKPLQ